MLKINFPNIKKNQIEVYYFDYDRYSAEMQEFVFRPTVQFKVGRLTSNGLMGNPNNKGLFHYFTYKQIRTDIFEPFRIEYPSELNISPRTDYKDFVEIDDDLLMIAPGYSTTNKAYFSWKSILEREEKLSNASSVAMDLNFIKYVTDFIFKQRLRDQKIKLLLDEQKV